MWSDLCFRKIEAGTGNQWEGGKEAQEAGGQVKFLVILQRRDGYLKEGMGRGVQWAEIAGKMDRSLYVIIFGECELMRKSNSRQ